MKFFISLIFLFILNSCSYIQLFETASRNTKLENDYYVFENDSIKICYNFYSEKGVMAFLVINKSLTPIYLDWSKSALIINNFKNNYWDDITESKTTGITHGAYFSGSQFSNYSTLSVKPEKITFIPPRSSVFKIKNHLFLDSYYKFNPNVSVEVIRTNGKKIKTYSEKFEKENSPLIFRNFLTFSFEENFSNLFYIDNEFYVNHVKQYNKRSDGSIVKTRFNFYLNTKIKPLKDRPNNSEI